jgi:hypothetical protein
MSIEAMKLMIEHIEGNYTVSAEEAIAAGRQAIAETEKQEPVAYIHPCDLEVLEKYSSQCQSILYRNKVKNRIPLYTAPPKSEWIGLTDEEQGEFLEMYMGINPNLRLLMKDIEAKLKEKNT